MDNGVPRTFVLGTTVEGQKSGFFAIKAGGQKRSEFIQREVNEGAAIEREDQLIRITCRLELFRTLKGRFLPSSLFF